MTTTMIRKDFWAVRFGDKAVCVRIVGRRWTVEGITFEDRAAAISAAAAMVTA